MSESTVGAKEREIFVQKFEPFRMEADELVGKIKHIYADTNLTMIGSPSGKISKNVLKLVCALFFTKTKFTG